MKSQSFSQGFTVTLLAMSTILQGAQALPALSSLIPRPLARRDGFSVITLVHSVRDYLKDKNAYDPDVPGKCVLSMTTFKSSLGCMTTINCRDSDKYWDPLPDWNVCYLGGRQFFTHPKIGDFSITYTEKEGHDGNTLPGMYNPVVQLANINNWEEINVQKLIDDAGDSPHGNLCKRTMTFDVSEIVYKCGLPQIGQAAFGISNYNPPSDQPGFAPGWCTMHVVQYQKNEYGTGDQYTFDVVIFDNDKKEIGSVQKQAVDPDQHSLSVFSSLPLAVVIVAGNIDSDNVEFKYGDQAWKSLDGTHQNTFATTPRWGYENGNRKGDMGFNC